jgi:pimeloyl-ACP methyl ester carboxylesterase
LITWPLQVPLSHLVTDEFSPIASARRLTVPFLVIHARGDRVVPIEHGRRLFRAAPPGRKAFWEIASDAHLAAFGDEASPYRPRLVAFLDDALHARSAADATSHASCTTPDERDAGSLAAVPHAW